MNWYSGNIAEAIALSKKRNAVFVVYIEGKDESSQKLSGFINNEKIKTKLESEKFVAIKIEGGSTEYMQFAQIYQLVPLPSIFFIGKNGTPLEIATSVTSSINELDEKIENVLKMVGLSNDNSFIPSESSTPSSSTNLALASTSFIANEQQSTEKNTTSPSSPDIVCVGDVCYRKPETVDKTPKQTEPVEETKSTTEEVPKTLTPSEQTEPVKETKSTTQEVSKTLETSKQTEQTTKEEVKVVEVPPTPPIETVQDKVELAKKLMEEKRRERDLEEARLEREREIKRRKEGQEMQNLKKWQKDQDLNDLKEKLQRDKMEEQAARQRILEQIAADRAERARKMNYPLPQQQNEQPSTSKQSTATKTENTSAYARIQFRKPAGDSETHNFLPSDQFKVVREFVKSDLLNGKIKEFSLATTFPRREFSLEDDTKTLKELDLYPSAVLLVLIPTITSTPSAIVARSGGFVNIFNTVFWTMLSPIFYVYNFVKGYFTGQRPGGGGTGAGQKRPNPENATNEASKKRNIARFQSNELVDDSSAVSSSSTTRINLRDKSAHNRVGNSNVHRLRDQKDSDDENNTWNGNSTQQQ